MQNNPSSAINQENVSKNTMKKRNDVLNRLKKEPKVTVLVVGGGINGVGTFRDLALQGVDVLLVDKGDFCSGVSMA